MTWGNSAKNCTHLCVCYLIDLWQVPITFFCSVFSRTTDVLIKVKNICYFVRLVQSCLLQSLGAWFEVYHYPAKYQDSISCCSDNYVQLRDGNINLSTFRHDKKWAATCPIITQYIWTLAKQHVCKRQPLITLSSNFTKWNLYKCYITW